MHSKGEDELVISFQFLQRFEEKISCQGIHCKLGPKELWVKSETIVFLFFGLQNKFRENRLDFILHITHSNILHWKENILIKFLRCITFCIESLFSVFHCFAP